MLSCIRLICICGSTLLDLGNQMLGSVGVISRAKGVWCKDCLWVCSERTVYTYSILRREEGTHFAHCGHYYWQYYAGADIWCHFVKDSGFYFLFSALFLQINCSDTAASEGFCVSFFLSFVESC